VLVGVVFVVSFAIVRAISLWDLVRSEQQDSLDQDVRLMAVALTERDDHGIAATVGSLVAPGQELVVRRAGAVVGSVRGATYDLAPGEQVLTSITTSGELTLQLTQDPHVVTDIVRSNVAQLVLVGVGLLGLTAVVGTWLAGRISAPFAQLAQAADDLGRGRFDLSLPTSRMHEVQAIGIALDRSARTLEARLRVDRAAQEQASHELRTPLTSLRLEFEDLAGRDDVLEDVRDLAGRSLGRIDRLDEVTGQLLREARGRSMMEGARAPLRDVLERLATRWEERLAEHGVSFRVTVDGDVEITPGLLEQVMDQLLAGIDMITGPIVADVIAAEGLVTVDLTGATPVKSSLDHAHELAEMVGGMVAQAGDAVRVRLPVR
jgi:signal transduction histidine kinase